MPTESIWLFYYCDVGFSWLSFSQRFLCPLKHKKNFCGRYFIYSFSPFNTFLKTCKGTRHWLQRLLRLAIPTHHDHGYSRRLQSPARLLALTNKWGRTIITGSYYLVLRKYVSFDFNTLVLLLMRIAVSELEISRLLYLHSVSNTWTYPHLSVYLFVMKRQCGLWKKERKKISNWRYYVKNLLALKLNETKELSFTFLCPSIFFHELVKIENGHERLSRRNVATHRDISYGWQHFSSVGYICKFLSKRGRIIISMTVKKEKKLLTLKHYLQRQALSWTELWSILNFGMWHQERLPHRSWKTAD